MSAFFGDFMKRTLLLICLTASIAAAAQAVALSKYPQNLIRLASHGLDNQSDPKAVNNLQVEIVKIVSQQIASEASKYKLSEDKYIADKRSLDNFIIYLEANTSEESLNKLSPEELLIFSIETGIRFQRQHRVRFPDLVKLEKIENILNGKLMIKFEAALEQRKKISQKPKENTGADYDTSVNQLQRGSKIVDPELEPAGNGKKDSAR